MVAIQIRCLAFRMEFFLVQSVDRTFHRILSKLMSLRIAIKSLVFLHCYWFALPPRLLCRRLRRSSRLPSRSRRASPRCAARPRHRAPRVRHRAGRSRERATRGGVAAGESGEAQGDGVRTARKIAGTGGNRGRSGCRRVMAHRRRMGCRGRRVVSHGGG